MKIIFFSHPEFEAHQSMPRFTRMLVKGMESRGHKVEVWSPKAKFFKLVTARSFQKWLGYIDQYIVFPIKVRKHLRHLSRDTLIVFTDHALGPWVPLAKGFSHVIHCHDFLAQQSALGEIPQNRTSWSGKIYQAFIRRGYQQGKNFISVSAKTQADLHQLLVKTDFKSSMVYNGLNNVFEPCDIRNSRRMFGKKINLDLTGGYIMHVGGNQWYKNRLGVIEIYDAWRARYQGKLPLIMIGEVPSAELMSRLNQSLYEKDIHFLSNVNDSVVKLAYTGASLLVFPSISEGFGWPVAEAMACGCPVVTTDNAPMTEVAGKAGHLIPKSPVSKNEVKFWAQESAKVINVVVTSSDSERELIVKACIENAKRFNTENALNIIENLYREALEGQIVI